jgi:hypothetical protein
MRSFLRHLKEEEKRKDTQKPKRQTKKNRPKPSYLEGFLDSIYYSIFSRTHFRLSYLPYIYMDSPPISSSPRKQLKFFAKFNLPIFFLAFILSQ